MPGRLVVRDCALTLDGGTIHLMASDEAGRDLGITLVTSLCLNKSTCVAGRLYFDGMLVPMRSEREAQILRLLSEAMVQAPRVSPARRGPHAIIGEDTREFFEKTPEENCRAFIRKIIESVQSETYLHYATDEEKAVAAESNRDDWERPSGKKKRRTWRRSR